MKVSIVIPTFNRAGYLKEAIESVLGQDYENIEIIVCDNASSDDTPSVVASYMGDGRLRYVRNRENVGMVNNWKQALYSHVSGEWFVILSDDDYFIDAQYISKAVALANSENDVVMVYSNGYVENVQTGERQALDLPFKGVVNGEQIFLSRGKVLPQDFTLCNVMFNTRRAMELKPFSNPLNVSCDSELFLRLCLRGKVGVINDYSSVYRIHGNNLLSKVRSDFDLFINNLDFAITPYMDAFSSDRLDDAGRKWFEENCLLRALRSFLLYTVTHHRGRIAEAEKKVRSIGNGVGSKLLSLRSRSFYIKYLIRKHLFMFYKISRQAKGKPI